MPGQSTVSYEGGRAQVAPVWLLNILAVHNLVPVQVLLQGLCLLERLATLGAVAQVHSTCVQLLVPLQRCPPAEFGRAQWARILHLACVDTQVPSNTDLQRELQATNGAGVLLLAGVQD